MRGSVVSSFSGAAYLVLVFFESFVRVYLVKRVGLLCVLRDVGFLYFVFFFFQAEDGIRDLTVTGVQTCALPISLWQRSIKLLDQTRGMPVQARGRTKVSTNLRVQPGRMEPRLYQFGRNVPVEIVGRAAADWVQGTDEKDSSNEPQDTKKEDWFLVRALATRPPGEAAARAAETSNTTQPGDQTAPIAGWVVARFVELDLPDPVREGAASANIRPLAWFELNRVSDPAGDKPQYLVAAAPGPEGQVCDFTALRVYTWYVKKSRYETAFIENNLCGQLPIRIGKGPKGEPEFRFRVMDGKKEERVYHLMQTVVRRVREPGEASGKRGATKMAKPAAK